MHTAVRSRIVDAETEAPDLDFKAAFDPSSTGDWCELVKDIVAFANSGGGWIVFGVNDDGSSSNADLGQLQKVDPAIIVDKIAKYTGQQFAGVSLATVTRNEAEIVAMSISGATMPIVFTATGNYEVNGKQRNAFQKGTVYFRHGAKSEPGTSEDLRGVLERELDRVRSVWLDGIQKVVTAPPGAAVSVVTGEVRLSGGSQAADVRLVNDENAPALNAVRTDLLYPHRQKELIAKVNAALAAGKITSHDVVCVRKVHGIEANPNFFYKPQYSSPQYSDAFAGWLVEQYTADAQFFQKARDASKK